MKNKISLTFSSQSEQKNFEWTLFYKVENSGTFEHTIAREKAHSKVYVKCHNNSIMISICVS